MLTLMTVAAAIHKPTRSRKKRSLSIRIYVEAQHTNATGKRSYQFFLKRKGKTESCSKFKQREKE